LLWIATPASAIGIALLRINRDTMPVTNGQRLTLVATSVSYIYVMHGLFIPFVHLDPGYAAICANILLLVLCAWAASRGRSIRGQLLLASLSTMSLWLFVLAGKILPQSD